MTDVEKKEEGQGGDNTEETVSTVDAFGMEDNPKPSAKEEGKEDKKGGDGKKTDDLPSDHPKIVELNNRIEEVKREYGGNLSGQRKLIESLQAEIKTLKEGGTKADDKKNDPNLPFPEIKWAKDLTQEERDEMTDKEIAQMDVIAKMQEVQNNTYLENKNGKVAQETKAVEDRQSLVKNTALELAKEASGKDDVELANQIIESVKQFNLEGLDEATIKERVKTAHSLLPTYKAPKEQKKVDGKVVTGTKTDSDPFGVDAIVESATKAQEGNYDL